mmetsp:Transcript_149125/g.273813  ORF Transcript_149125/g.273813 Transcript_149125/m.273813 type:complete len:98 (-) Transcript_149125:154-447(-)
MQDIATRTSACNRSKLVDKLHACHLQTAFAALTWFHEQVSSDMGSNFSRTHTKTYFSGQMVYNGRQAHRPGSTSTEQDVPMAEVRDVSPTVSTLHMH